MTIASTPRQLPLALAYAPQYGRDAFVPGQSNEAALKLIETWPDWPSAVALVCGPAGSGKTHLAHIWAGRAGAAIVEGAGLRVENLPPFLPGSGVAVEDVDALAIPEAALFHLINRVKEQSASLLLTAREPAERWAVRLPDLRSRLRQAMPATLGAPDDELLRKVLVKLFADRQLIVERQVIDYLVVRMERSLSFAASLVRTLDSTALAAGRRITRPMAALTLAELSTELGEFADRQ